MWGISVRLHMDTEGQAERTVCVVFCVVRIQADGTTTTPHAGADSDFMFCAF